MASITKDSQTLQVADNSSIQEACEKLDVQFSCRSGYCGTCQIEIECGEDNLYPLTAEEQDMGMDKRHRLACQCRIKRGNIVIR